MATAAATGAVTGFLGVGLLSKVTKVGSLAIKAVSRVPKAARFLQRGVSGTRGAITRIAKPNTTAYAHTASVRAQSSKVWTYERKTRPSLGRDGGRSWHLVEKYQGRTNAIIHRVKRGRELVHQHVTHVGRYGTRREFPDEWTGIRSIGRH